MGPTSVLAVLALAALLTTAHASTAHSYGVLIDAGSSSSKVKVYRYQRVAGGWDGSPGSLPRVELVESERVKPSLGSMLHDDQGLQDYMAGLVDVAAGQVPYDVQPRTPIFLMATAGLRTLSQSDARALLGGVRRALGDPDVSRFRFAPRHAAILSGEEEAAYAWLALNYLNGFFHTNMSRSMSLGLLEVGGGSLQVAFLPDGPLYQEEFQLYMGRRRFDLYATSYLSFGMNYLNDKVLTIIKEGYAKMGRTNGDMANPCMMRGDRTDPDASGTVFVGTSTPALCEALLNRFLTPAKDYHCAPRPCAIGDRYQPPVGMLNFYATSAFKYAPRALGAIEATGRLDVAGLLDTAKQFCAMSVIEGVAAYPGIKADYASRECLQGLYIPLLLTEALGFKPDTTMITVTGELNGQDIDWALGAMLQQLSMAWLDAQHNTGAASGQTPLTPEWLPLGITLNVAILALAFS